MSKRNIVLTVLFFCAFLAVPSFSRAAEFYFNSAPADSVTERLDVFVNTQGAEINSVGGKVVFSNPVSVAFISDGGSIVSLWVRKPAVQDKEVVFSGVIPGGYNSEKGFLFSLFLFSDSLTNTTATFERTEIFLNDGQGTPVGVTTKPLNLIVANGIGENREEIFGTDKEKPEAFIPEITKDPNVFDGKWFLVFAAQDKESGIDHYEVKEGQAQFKETASPFLLADQSLGSEIQVKAVDRNGNERLVKISPLNPPRFYQKVPFYAILILIIVLAVWQNLRKGHEQQT